MITVATDGAEMYGSEVRKAIMRYFGNRFDAVSDAALAEDLRELAPDTTDDLS